MLIDKTIMRTMGENTKPIGEIQKMIDVVNLVPFNAELPIDFQELEIKFPELAKYLSSPDLTFLTGIPVKTYRIIRFEELRKLLAVIVEISETYHIYLNALASLNEQPKTNPLRDLMESLPDFPLNYLDKELGARFFEIAAKFLSITTNKSHQLQLELNGLLQDIEKSDLRRFKQCVVCKKFIWASRLNKKYCSTNCANIATQRVFQSDPQKRDAYNEKRRNANKSKKELKQGKERRKKNGTL